VTAKEAPYQSPAVKTGRNTRFRRDRQADIDAAADRPGRDSSQLIRYGADLMLRSIRCGRCDEAVPLVLGDTSGRDMYDWMEAADRAILRQKHGDHTPVLVGAETGSQAQDGDGAAGEAATTEEPARERTEPSAPIPAQRRKTQSGADARRSQVAELRATGRTPAQIAEETGVTRQRVQQILAEKAPSLPVAAESTSAVTAARLASEVPGVGLASELAPPAAVPVFKAGPDVDCLHENFRGVKGVCPDCKQWVGGRK